MGNELAKLLSEQKIVPPKITTISLEGVPTYLEIMQQGQIKGKVVVDFT